MKIINHSNDSLGVFSFLGIGVNIKDSKDFKLQASCCERNSRVPCLRNVSVIRYLETFQFSTMAFQYFKIVSITKTPPKKKKKQLQSTVIVFLK